MTKDQYKFSRFMYILEAAFEYFISMIVGGAYLAKITSELGISDSVTGILGSIVSLACGMQIFAIFLFKPGSSKRGVTVLHSINQLCFAFIYLVPFIEISRSTKIVIFVLLLLSGHFINNVVQPSKINWFMGLVDNNKRGRFTANKEIVSLLGGMVFSFTMGSIIDRYEAMGRIRESFIICGITIFGLAALHTATLILSKEKSGTEKERAPMKQMLAGLLRDRSYFKVIFVSVLWNIAHYVSTPFYSTYTIKELGFSMTLVSVMSMVYAITRSTFSRPLGRYADKHSFSKMLNICFGAAMIGFTVNIFTVPSNGKVFYMIYYILYAVGMAGINSGGINLIYEHVSPEQRVCALALKNTLAGIAGFLTTLAASRLVAYIQANGNTFLGINAYAQQVTSAISVVLVGVTILYLNTVVIKRSSKR